MELVDVFPKDVTHNDISQTPLSHLTIISTALSQKEYKHCKFIVDNGSCTNVVFFEVFENDGLKWLPHSHPYHDSSLQSYLNRFSSTLLENYVAYVKNPSFIKSY